ncbi:MAG: RrF2 family transcriptional regulator [Streptomycetales bacterium]
MRITAKTDYAVRATTELVSASAQSPVRADDIAQRQRIPVRFLLNILAELRVAGIVSSRRGAEGGYWLAAPAYEISVADLIRAVEGPLADVHGVPPEKVDYQGSATALREVWIATRAALRKVLETVTLADIAAGDLPPDVMAQLSDPDTLRRR